MAQKTKVEWAYAVARRGRKVDYGYRLITFPAIAAYYRDRVRVQISLLYQLTVASSTVLKEKVSQQAL